MVGLTKVNEFDEFGMLKKTEVHQAGKTILSNTYAYKTRNDSKYLSKQISSESIKVGNQSYTRKYTTDALGNLTSISDSTFGNHLYEYDYRGFLTKADGEEYEYDGNGNITRKGSINFVYDNVIKDRLVSVNGVAISYDSSNPLNPTKYGSKRFTFEGRRLTRLTLTSGYYEYKYNDQGLRIQKKDYRGIITWDYTYDGDKLIYESSPYGKLNFLYDENNMLYGFIKDNTEKYLYIRDNLQNIIAITTLSGEIVVKNTYDGWDYLIMAGGSAILSGLTAWGFGKISNNLSFFKDSNFILDNFSKFATNYGGITLKSTVILQAAGQIAIRETIAGFVGAPLSGIPGYFDRVYRLNKQGLSPVDSFLYAF